MYSPSAQRQLLRGFWGLENRAWRWTAQDFSVALKPPSGAAQKGAALNLFFNIPEAHLSKLKSVALSAEAGTEKLSPETYDTPGPGVYQRDVPSSALTGDVVRIDFHLDKALQPPAEGQGDRRTLGIIANKVELIAK